MKAYPSQLGLGFYSEPDWVAEITLCFCTVLGFTNMCNGDLVS